MPGRREKSRRQRRGEKRGEGERESVLWKGKMKNQRSETLMGKVAEEKRKPESFFSLFFPSSS